MALLALCGRNEALVAAAVRDDWTVRDCRQIYVVKFPVPDLPAPDLIVEVAPHRVPLGALRAAADAIAAVPIVHVGDHPFDAHAYDDVLPAGATEADAAALLARWRPLSLEPLDAIEAAFGTAPVVDLLNRLRAQLLEGAANCAVRAHRLGGIAGMLGFDALSSAWLDVERDVPGARPTARIETRRALAAIARRLA